MSAHDEGPCIDNKIDDDDIVLDNDGESPINDASKVKPPRKQLRKEDAKSLKKKNTIGNIGGGKQDVFGSWCFHKDYESLLEL